MEEGVEVNVECFILKPNWKVDKLLHFFWELSRFLDTSNMLDLIQERIVLNIFYPVKSDL